MMVKRNRPGLSSVLLFGMVFSVFSFSWHHLLKELGLSLGISPAHELRTVRSGH